MPKNVPELEDRAVHLLFDSIGMIDFLAFIEETYRIRISDEDVLPENFRNLMAVARLIAAKLHRAP